MNGEELFEVEESKRVNAFGFRVNLDNLFFFFIEMRVGLIGSVTSL